MQISGTLTKRTSSLKAGTSLSCERVAVVFPGYKDSLTVSKKVKFGSNDNISWHKTPTAKFVLAGTLGLATIGLGVGATMLPPVGLGAILTGGVAIGFLISGLKAKRALQAEVVKKEQKSPVNTKVLPSLLENCTQENMDYGSKVIKEFKVIKSKIRNSSFEKASLHEAQFQDSIFDALNCYSGQFYKSKFTSNEIKNSNFERANLHKVMIFNTKFNDVNFTDAHCPQSHWTNSLFKNVKFNNADFNEASFEKATFEDCDFTGSKFNSAILNDCMFKNCNLSNQQKASLKLKTN